MPGRCFPFSFSQQIFALKGNVCLASGCSAGSGQCWAGATVSWGRARVGWSWSAGVNTAQTQPQAGGTLGVPTAGRWGCSLGTSVSTGCGGPAAAPGVHRGGQGPRRAEGALGSPEMGGWGAFLTLGLCC